MINDFIKAILYEKFDYNEDATFSVRAHAMYDGAKHLKRKMDDDGLLSELVIYGANNGFPGKLQKRIEAVLALRKKLPGNNDLSSATAKATLKLEREYLKLVAKSAAFKLNGKDSLGVRPLLAARIKAAKKLIKKLIDSGLREYECENLKQELEEAHQKLTAFEDTLSEIPDVSSQTAAEYAAKVAKRLDAWLNSTVISVIERGQTTPTLSLSSPLAKISKTLEEWGSTAGDEYPKVFSLGAEPVKHLDILLSEPVTGGIAEKRDELWREKEKNEHDISKIRDILQEFPKELRALDEYKKILASFSSHSLLTEKTPVGAGTDHFDDRIRTERDLSSFIRSTLELLDHTKTEATVKVLYQRTKLWLETKSLNEMRDTIMNESKLKKSLSDELSKTKRDFETLQRYSKITENAGLQSIAKQVIKTIDKNLVALEAASVANNKQNAETAERIVKKLAAIREKAFSFSAEFECGELSDQLCEIFASLLNSRNAVNDARKDFPLPTLVDEGKNYANVASGKTDVLTSALFVLRAECKNREFFKNLQLALDNEKNRATGGAITKIAAIDEKLPTIAKELDETIAKAGASTNPTEKLTLLKKAKELKAELDRLANEKSQLKALIDNYRVPESYTLMQKMLDQVARLFSNDIAAPYEVRAQVMAQNGLYDLESLYNEFRTLAFGHGNGFEIKLMTLTGTIDRVLEQFDTSRDITGFMRSESEKTAKTAETPVKTYEQTKQEEADELAELEKMFGLSGGAGTESATTETAEKDLKTGEVATVNTKESSIEALSSLVDDFGGI